MRSGLSSGRSFSVLGLLPVRDQVHSRCTGCSWKSARYGLDFHRRQDGRSM
jgi:hypothetical protein